MAVDRTPPKSQDQAVPNRAEHPAAQADTRVEQEGAGKPEQPSLTLGGVSWKDHQAALKAFEGASSTVALAQLDFHPLPTDHFGLPATAEQQKQINDASSASTNDRLFLKGAGQMSDDTPEISKRQTLVDVHKFALESLDRYKNLGDLKGKLSDNQASIDNIRDRDAHNVLSAAAVEFDKGNNRDSARDLVRQLYKTMGPDADKTFATDEAKQLTDALGMTKGQPFKELDTAKIAQDLSNVAYKALGGDTASEQQLRQAIQNLPSETLDRVAGLMQNAWGHDDKAQRSLTLTRDGKGDVTDLTFHSNPDGFFSRSSEVKILADNVSNQNADFAFANRVQQEYNKLDPQIRQLLEKNNVRVVVADKVTDVAPSDFNRQAIGLAERGDIVVGERADLPNSPKNQEPEETLRHEVGHKLDELLGHLTDSPEFMAAYAKDQQVMFQNHDWDNPTAKQFLTTQRPIGKQELAAEAYAKILGRPNEGPRSDEDQWFENHFVLSQRFLADKLNEFLRREKQ